MSEPTLTEGERQKARYQWLSASEVADRCGGVALSQVYGWISDGELTALDVRSKGAKQPDWRIKPEWVADFLAKRTHAA